MDLSTVPMYFCVGCSVRENEIGRRNQGSLDSRDYDAPLPGWKMGMKTPYDLGRLSTISRHSRFGTVAFLVRQIGAPVIVLQSGSDFATGTVLAAPYHDA